MIINNPFPTTVSCSSAGRRDKVCASEQFISQSTSFWRYWKERDISHIVVNILFEGLARQPNFLSSLCCRMCKGEHRLFPRNTWSSFPSLKVGYFLSQFPFTPLHPLYCTINYRKLLRRRGCWWWPRCLRRGYESCSTWSHGIRRWCATYHVWHMITSYFLIMLVINRRLALNPVNLRSV